VIMAPL